MIDVAFDMETADPDDIFTLCFLISHPEINLRAVTVTPGSKHQVGLVKKILDITECTAPVGTIKGGYPKSCVSEFHSSWLQFEAQDPDEIAEVLLAETLYKYPDLVLLTGAPLKNIHRFIDGAKNYKIQRWVAQGGFAGDNVVPPEYRLDKFNGMETCPTFNFNGDPTGAKLALSDANIIQKDLVSKNVCHGMVYDSDMHERVKPYKDKNKALKLMYEGMSAYLSKRSSGKAFHDPLAAAVIVNRDICEFREVEVYREKGQWGSRLKAGTNTFISIKADRNKFIETLVA